MTGHKNYIVIAKLQNSWLNQDDEAMSTLLTANYRKIMGQTVWANNADPDQTPLNAASDQGLHRLPLIQQFSGTSTGS